MNKIMQYFFSKHNEYSNCEILTIVDFIATL